MKRIGSTVQAAQGLAIVRSEGDPPDIGTNLIDEELSPVGRVVDVFGPVERPYIAVSPESGRVASLVGAPLYARGE
jgi:RNA-binding protein